MRAAGNPVHWVPAGWFWLVGAPATVVFSWLWSHHILTVFALYQLGFCLVLPAVCNLARRNFSLKEHLEYLGLLGPGGIRVVVLSLVLGAFSALAVLASFHFFGHVFLARHDVPGTLASWGVTRSTLPLVFWFMTLVSGPAEEIYWRGFVHRSWCPKVGGGRGSC